MVRARWGSVSIVGNFRENNEDRCFTDEKGRFFLVCDGMGGQAAGEKASELAAEMVSQKLRNGLNFDKDAAEKVVSVIDDAVSQTNMEIMALGEIEPDFHNMGTTIAFLIVCAGKLYAGGVGDSRAYRFRDGELEQLTKDHSLTQALIDAGTLTPEEAANHRYKNVLYRYLGTKEGGSGTEPKTLEAQAGDRFVLCSDGVTDGLKESVLKRLLTEKNEPQQAAQAIVDAALEGGSKDNITCVVVHFD
jgi:protein phosphatase